MPSKVASSTPFVVRAGAAALIAASSFAVSASASEAIDRIGVPGPIVFDGTDYALAWSSNPSSSYSKQEYLPEGQVVETYASMVLVEIVAGVDVKAALAVQVNMLNQRKGSDPLVRMDVLQNNQTGEVILDFLVSAKDADGQYIAEWNAYRYAPHAGGVMLFAISHRAYGDDEVRGFLSSLRTVRPDQINKVAQQQLPRPTLPQ